MIQQSEDIKQIDIGRAGGMSRYQDEDVVIIETLPALVSQRTLHLNLCVVMLCVAGRMSFKINGKRAALRQNQVLFCQPKVMFEDYALSDDFDCRILCLSDEIVRRLLVDKLNLWTMAVYVERTHVIDLSREDIELFAHYHALIQAKTRGGIGTPAEAKSLHAILRGMLLDLSRPLSAAFQGKTTAGRNALSHDRIVFLDFMKLLSDAEVKKHPVEYYASLLCVSPKYLGQVCKKHSGKTAGQWIGDYIKEDIRYYLAKESLSVKQVAVMLGFDNLSFFGKYVKKCFGVSPRVYREQCHAAGNRSVEEAVARTPDHGSRHLL